MADRPFESTPDLEPTAASDDEARRARIAKGLRLARLHQAMTAMVAILLAIWIYPTSPWFVLVLVALFAAFNMSWLTIRLRRMTEHANPGSPQHQP